MSDAATQLISRVESAVAGCKIEHLKDQPDDSVVTLKIETPFFNFDVDQTVTIFAFYKEDEDLVQFSDRGLYSFCVEDRSNISIKRHRNFIRSSGYLIMASETEEGAFVVNTPTVKLSAEGLDLSLLLAHYISLLCYAGEV